MLCYTRAPNPHIHIVSLKPNTEGNILNMTEDIERNEEYAMLTVGVTTACGITQINDANVTVYYNGQPGSDKKESESCLTDENGRTKSFAIREGLK